MKRCLSCFSKIFKKDNKRFCSTECGGIYRRYLVINAWLNGELHAYTGRTLRLKPAIRYFLIYINDDRCSLCGFSGVNPYSNRSILEVDHIDGNALNDSIENLRVICPNCHAMTENYRALNKKSYRNRRAGSLIGRAHSLQE